MQSYYRFGWVETNFISKKEHSGEINLFRIAKKINVDTYSFTEPKVFRMRDRKLY